MIPLRLKPPLRDLTIIRKDVHKVQALYDFAVIDSQFLINFFAIMCVEIATNSRLPALLFVVGVTFIA
jgi:hypothetical protein